MLKLGVRSKGSRSRVRKKNGMKADGFQGVLCFALIVSYIFSRAAFAQDLSLVEQKVHKLSDTVCGGSNPYRDMGETSPYPQAKMGYSWLTTS